jgi:AAA domain
LTRELEPPEYICGRWLTTTSRTIGSADTGIGKTLFAIGFGITSAAKLPFLHWSEPSRPIRVLYIDGEMSRRVMKQRLIDAVARLDRGVVPPECFHMLSHEDVSDGTWMPLNTTAGQQLIEKQIARIGGVDLIVFDNVMSLILGDQKDEEGWQKVMPWVRSLTRRRIAQLWLHHTGHDTTRGYGTKTRDWQQDNVIHLDRVERADTDVSFNLTFKKAREREPKNRAEFVDVRIALVNNQWTWQPASGGKQGKIEPQAQKFYEALCFATANSGRQQYGCPAATIDHWRTVCQNRGLIDRDAKPNSARSLFSKNKIELISKNWIACDEELAWTLAENRQFFV